MDEHEGTRGGGTGDALAGPVRPVRRFGDEEIRSILGRAAELQERSYTIGRDPERGLTLDELRQIAAEAGIDPAFVDLAAADADAPIERNESRLAGGTYRWHFRTTVPGEVPESDRYRMLHAIRSVMGQKGEMADVYGRMEWSYDDALGPVVVGITVQDGHTEIDVTASRAGEAGLYHGMGIPMGGLTGGAALGAALGLSGPAVVPLVVAVGGVVYGGTRVLWAARSRWWERHLRRLVDRLASVVQEVAAHPPGREADRQ